MAQTLRSVSPKKNDDKKQPQGRLGNINTLTKALTEMTPTQRAALQSAVSNNKEIVEKGRSPLPEESAYFQYAQAIKDLTDESGKVHYDPDAYKFNPYTDGLPDETARKAYESLSYRDQLLLEIGKNGKPKTPDFGDPKVDTSVYDRYQQALAKVEADEKAAAEEAKIQTQKEADDNAVKAVEDLYRNNRGNYSYDPTMDVKAIKGADKNITLTQSELKDIFEGLQSQYDWDDDAYNAWVNPVADTEAQTVVAEVPDAKQSARKGNGVFKSIGNAITGAIESGKQNREARKQAELPVEEATDPYDSQKAYDAYWAAKDAGASDDDAWKAAYGAVYTPEELAAAEKARDDYMRIKGNTAFMRTIAKLTGKDKIEHWARANKDGSFENDTKYMVNQAVQGIGDVVGGVALIAGLATKATIDAATSTTWLLSNGGKPWTMEEARSRFALLDEIMYIAETTGSGKYNAYHEAGKEKASEVAQYIGGLSRSLTSSVTAAAMGNWIGAAAPQLTTTFNLADKLGAKAPTAIKSLAKVVPEVQVGVNQVPFLAQSFASGYNEALATGYDQAGALAWGSWTALAEGIPESISWNWSAATGSNLKSQVYGSLNKDAAKTATKKGLKNLMAHIGDSGVVKVLAALNAEGMSEVMTNYLDWIGRKTILKQDVDLPTLRENLATYGTGALLSAITQGFSYAASTPARKQAESIVDGMVNGQPPTSEQVQTLDDSLNDAAAQEPISNDRLDELHGEGLQVDEKTTADYRAANDAFYKAEQGAANALARLQQMNANGVAFGSPERVAAVKEYAEARKEYALASQKRKDAHAKFLKALDGDIQATEAAAAEAEAEQQRIAEEYAEWQYTEMLQNDPQGLVTVATELQQAVNEDLAAAKTALHQAGFADSATRADLMLQVKNLQASNAKLQQMIDEANAAIAPTTAAEIPANVDVGLTQAFDEASLAADVSEVVNKNRDQLKAVDTIAKKYGRKVVMVDTLKGKTISGQTITADVNGYYDPQTGAIYIAADAQEGAFSYFAIHELVHSIKNSDPEGYEALCDTIMEELVNNGEDVDALIDYQQNVVYNGSIDLETAIEEVVANTAPAILTDENYVRSMYEGNRSLFDKIRDFFNELKQAFANLTQYRSWEQGASLGADSVAKIAEVFDRVAATPDGGGGGGARFSLKKPVERVGNLVAVHSLSARNAINAVRKGGIPAPSIALIERGMDVPAFGDVTIVFPRNTIDPEADPRNNVYPGDAYTPMHPATASTIPRDVDNRIKALVENLSGKMSRLGQSVVRNSFEAYADMSDDAIYKEADNNSYVMSAYLAENGRDISQYVEKDISWTDTRREIKKEVLKFGVKNKYHKWIDSILEGKTPGREYFLDEEGNQVQATLENIANYMAGMNGGEMRNAMGNGAEGLFASMTPRLNSIADIHSQEHRLQHNKAVTASEMEGYNAKLNSITRSIIEEADLEGRSYGTHPDDWLPTLQAIGKGNDFSDQVIIETLQREGGFTPRQELVSDIQDLLTGLRDMKVPFFEAKLTRVVPITEAALALVPDSPSSKDVEKAFKSIGVKVVRYGDSHGSRVETLNKQTAKLRFSRKDFALSTRTPAAPVDKYQQYIPDFSNKNVKYGKAAAAEFVKNVEAAGEQASDIAAYAADKKVTSLKAKERAFWENVEKNITQAPQKNGKPKVMAFKPTPQQETAEDVVKVLDADSPYTVADSTDMKYEPSSYDKVRKPSSIKSDIQNILGFRFSDEHFRRDQRKAGAVAYYEPATKFVVSGDTNNLPAFLHDAGHHVALDQYNSDEVDVFKQMVPRKFLDQYPAEAQTAEAAAEMFRAWVMNPDKMERNFPETFEGMKRTLGNAKYARLRDQSAAIRTWFAADTQQKVSSVHRTTRDQEKANKEPVFSKFIKREADSAYGYKVLDRAMERAGVTLASSADARASCARTSSEAVHALLFDGIYDPNTGKKVCCGLVDTTKGLVTTATEKETLEVYLTLKQSYERYSHNKKDWTLSKDVCTPAEAKAYIDNVENHQPNIHRAAQNIWEYLKNYRHTNLSSAIPQSVIDKWDEQNKYYIPQTRVFTNNIRSAIKGGGVSGSGTGVNRRGEGSTRDFLAPSDAIVQMITKTKTAALKHETLKTLQEYYDADQTGTIGNYIHEVEPGVYITPVDGSTVTDATMKALSKGELDAETLTLVNDILEGNSPETVVFRYGDPNGRKNNIVAITENGHTRYFEVMDQDLMDAIAPMSKQQLNSVFEAISKVQRMTSSLITSNNPFFATSNAIRDFVTGYVTGSEQNPFKYTRDYVGAAIDVAKDAIGKDESGIVAQYRAMGGGGGLAQSFATADNVNSVTSAMYGKAGDNRIAIKRSLDKVGSAIQAINGGVETIPRLAEYKRQLAAGASYPEAIKAAKNVTTDFSTSGTHSKVMSTVWRFYSAQVNGLYKTYNLFADGKTSAKQKQLLQRRMGALAGTITASTLIHFLNYIFDDDDEYAALPDYIKEGYYIFTTGKPGKFIRIPKPNDPLLVVTDSIARNITDAAIGVWREGADAGDAIRQEASDILGDLVTALIPFGEVNTANPLGSNFVGNAALQWANNKTWTGATVVPKAMEGMSAALQYDDDTSWVSRMIGKAFNISPMKLDNFLDQNTGVIGEVSDAVSEGIETGKQEGIAKGVAAGFKEAFLSRFLVDSAYSQGVTSSFYDMKSDLQRLVDDVEYSIEMGDGPYSTVIKGLTPQQTGQASKEAEARLKTMNEVAKQLKELGQLATKAEQAGDKEKARQFRIKQQELAATAAYEAAEFFDKWKSANK